MNAAVWNDTTAPLHQRITSFLNAAAGGDELTARRCYIAAFAEDPTGDYDSGTRARMWAGAPAAQYLQRPLDRNVHDTDNIYMVVSVFRPGDDGRVRRRQALCERTLFIMIDDVGHGTSAKVDPDTVKLLPTWSVETSPGNEQLWYRIDPAATDPDTVNRVVDALIRKGLAKDNDPGMKGVTRYGRLPFGLNTKAKYCDNGHPGGYPVRLVLERTDFDRSYSLEQFAAAWGIEDALAVPPKVSAAPPLNNTPGVGAFNTELLERMELLGFEPRVKPSTDGVYLLDVCPFAEKHGDRAGANGAAVFLIGATSDGVTYERGWFKCHHSHGDHDKWTQLMERLGLADEYRDIEAAASFGAADLEALRAESRSIGEGITAPAPAKLREMFPPTMNLTDMTKRFVLLESSGMIGDFTRPKLTMSRQTFHDVLSHNKTLVNKMTAAGPKIVPVATTKLWLESNIKIIATTVTFHPGAPAICGATEEGEDYNALNLWRPAKAHAPPEDWKDRVGTFVEHMAYLAPVDDEREHFLDWLAHMEQRPQERPHSHWLMIATQTGIGRSYLGALMARVAPGYVALNFRLVQSLASGFNGRLSSKILAVVDELNEGGEVGDRWAHSEVLKSLLTEEHLCVNPKYGMERIEMNCLRFLAFSNHITALPLDQTDRRWWVVRNPSEPRDQAYYAHLYGQLADPAFICSVREWLRQRDLSRFNPFTRPAMNLAKQELVGASTTEEEERFAELLEEHVGDLMLISELLPAVFSDTGFLDVRLRNVDIAKMGQRMKHMLTRRGGGLYIKPIKLDGRRERIAVLRRIDFWRSKDPDQIRTALEKQQHVVREDEPLLY